jgi:hypothetical protein
MICAVVLILSNVYVYILDGQRRTVNALQEIQIYTIMLVICFTKVWGRSLVFF